MPIFSAGQVKMESGVLYSSSMQVVNRVTDVKIGGQIPHANINVLNRGKPLEARPVINYSPVDVSFDLLKSDNSLETMLGLINPTGVGMLITDTNAATATYGIRSMQVYFAPTSSANYNGLYDIKSGVLTSYALQGSISEPMRQSISMSFLDISGSVNNTLRDATTYASAVIKPANISLTGIQFTGYGLTGITVQSFSLNISFSRTQVMQLGQKFPQQRPLTDIVASLQLQGYMEGLNSSLTGLSQYDCGTPTYGTIGLTMVPLCAPAGSSPSQITITNPYLESFSVNGQVGNFSTFSIALSMPLGPNPLEVQDGSTLALT